MTPRCTSRCSTSTAVRPPKVRVTLSAVRIGSGLAAPGVRSTSASARSDAATSTSNDRPGGAVAASAGAARPPPARCPPQACRCRSSSRAHRASIASSLRSPKIPCGRKIISNIRPSPRKMRRIRLAWVSFMIDAGMIGSAPAVAWPKNRSSTVIRNQKMIAPDHGAEDARRSADQQHRVGEEGHVGGEEGRPDRGRPQRDHETGQRTEEAADDQRLHLVGVDVLAERAYGVLVLADRLQHATPRTAHQQPGDQAGDRRPVPSRPPSPRSRWPPTSPRPRCRPARRRDSPRGRAR